MTSPKSQVAIKEIDLKKLPQKELDQLIQEKNLLREIKHPNIIELMNVFEVPDYNFMIFEFCKGGDLFDKISTEGIKKKKKNFLLTLFFFFIRWIHRIKRKKDYENTHRNYFVSSQK